jgi:alkylated DNA repair dioxygenase AlkB
MMLDIQVLDMAWDKRTNVVGLNIQNIILSSYQSGIGWHPDKDKSFKTE